MEFNDGQELGCNHEGFEGFASNLTDSEDDSTVGCSCCPSVRCSKRRFEALVVDGSVCPLRESRKSRKRIREQFVLLRAVVPGLCSDEQESILTGTCEYIEKLQKLETELRCELDTNSCWEEDVSCCEDGYGCVSSSPRVDSFAGSEEASSCCSQPKVQVVRTEQGLRLHVECERRPGLLVGIMELLESSGLVEEANIECADQCLVFNAIGISEAEAGSELREEINDIAASATTIGALLISLIGDQAQGES